MESNDQDDIKTAARKCSKSLNISMNNVDKCMTSGLGNLIQHNNGVLTDQLSPPHQYVPWITLNGVHTDDIENKALDDLVGLICDTYKVITSL